MGRSRADRAGPGDRRLPAVRLDAARTPTCASGSPARPPRAGWTSSTDRAGNLWAWWGDPRRATGPGVVLGSHLDSVPDGGAFDGPLGVVVGARRASTRCAAAGSPRPARWASRCFGDEEGARFGVACAGSRLLTGALDRRPRARADRRRRGDAWPRRCARPAATRPRSAATTRRCAGSGRSSSCTSSRAAGWTELDRAVGVGTGIWPHGRWRSTCRARPTTRAPPRWPTGATRCSPSPRSSSPPAAAAALARRAGHRRQGRGRRRTGSTPIPSRGHGLARRPRRPATTPCGRSSRTWRASVAAHGGTVAEESWTPATAFDAGLARPARRAARRAGARLPAGDRRRPRRRHPGRGRRPDGDAVRPQPDRASRTRPPSTPTRADCLAGVDALTAVAGRARRRVEPTVLVPQRRPWLGPRTRCCPAASRGRRRSPSTTAGIAAVDAGAGTAPGDAIRLPGVVLPGFANAHSHAFHRALRGRTHDRRRHVLDLARADVRRRRPARPRTPTSRWPGPPTPRWRWPGSPPSASSTTCTTRPAAAATPTRTRWAHALSQAAADAGVRLTLLDTCYLAGGLIGTGTPARPASSAGSPTATSTPGRPGVAALPRRAPALRSARPRTRCAPCPRDAARARVAGAAVDADGPAARPPLRAARRERRLPAPSTAAPRPACSPTEGLLGPRHHRRARHPPHRRRRRRCSAAPAPRSASARPPSATSPTASARPGGCATPAARSALGSDQHAVIDLFEEARGAGAARAAGVRRARPLHARRAARRR